MNRNGIVHLDFWGIKIFSLLGVLSALILILLGFLSYGAFVHFVFSLSALWIAWQDCWLSTPVSRDHMTRNGIIHLDCWSIKIFSLLGVLSAFIFILWGFVLWCFCPFLSYFCPPMGSHDKNVDCPHLYHVITWTEMWSYTLMVGVLKYFLIGGFVRFEFYALGLLSYGVFCPFWLFFCPPMWSHDENIDCLHLYHVITWTEMGSYTLIVGVLKYFLFWGFCPLWFLSLGAFVHFGFSLFSHVIAWRECWLSTPVSCDHMNRNGIVHLDCWSIKIFSLLGVLSALIFILWGFSPMVLLFIFAFLCSPTGSHDENV